MTDLQPQDSSPSTPGPAAAHTGLTLTIRLTRLPDLDIIQDVGGGGW